MFTKSEMSRANQLSIIHEARRMGIKDRACLLVGFEHHVKLNGQFFTTYREAKAYLESLKQVA